MSSPIADQIQKSLRDYLSGTSTVREFDESFLAMAWDVPATLDSEASKLRGEILLLLAEYTAGHRTENELKQQLHEIATPSMMRSLRS